MIASASEQETAAQAPELQGIQLGLSISQALRQSLQQNYSVFVYAKAENGPPMPLAVRRLRLSDLPLQVNLDDSTAMTPQFKLSNFDRVIVGARISKSGNAIAQQGDITVELPGFNWRDNTRQSLQLEQ
jgi:cytochrome c-type biogenesis protein CcmH